VRQLKKFLLVFCLGIGVAGPFLIVRGHASSTSSVPIRLHAGDRFLSSAESEAFIVQARSSAIPRGGVIQFAAIPTSAQRAALEQLGVTISSYVPDMAYIASIPANVSEAQLQAQGVTYVGALNANDKIAEILQVSGTTPLGALDENGIPRFSIGFYPGISIDDAAALLAQRYGAIVTGRSTDEHEVEVKLPTDNWREIAQDDQVLWLEPYMPRVALNNSNRANTRADVAQAPPYSLSGGGVFVGEWDEGRVDASHPGLAGRVITTDGSSISYHSTHVAGTVMGSGAGSTNNQYKGMAPAAILISSQWWNTTSELEIKVQSEIENYNLGEATNSWGLGTSTVTPANCQALLGNYYSECQSIDDIVRGSQGKSIPFCWAAGNERGTSSNYCGSPAGGSMTWGTIIPFGTAKNVITVGAINSNNSSMASFSSWGPVDDGRLKPEVVAPGCQLNDDGGVTSTLPGGTYGHMCGTSMATPTVAGCIALLLERVHFTAFDPPLASTVKALLVAGADDLGDPGPEYDWGYGRVDITNSIDLFSAGTLLQDQVNNGEIKTWTFVNNGSLSNVAFTLAWDDPGSSAISGVELINNLNVRLIPPSGPAQYLPWVLNPANPSASATTGVDNINNLEQVKVSGPLAVGTWAVEVSGATVPQGPQSFSLVWTGGMPITSTNLPYSMHITGGANFSSVAGNASVPFTVYNDGSNADSYQVALSSSHGWTIAPNLDTVAVGAHSNAPSSYAMTIPPATPYGTVDTVYGTASSLGSPGLTDVDTVLVTVYSGRAISVASARDTAAVVGHTLSWAYHTSNLGIGPDTVSWSVSNDRGWPISPASGSLALDSGGSGNVNFNVTIPGNETPGGSGNILLFATSMDDPTVTDADTVLVEILALPPVPTLALLANSAITNDATPTLTWTPGSYSGPPGFGVFTYDLDLADDPGFTLGATRFASIAGTSYTTPALVDGTHYWRVHAKNAVGDSSAYTPTRSFTTDTQAPAAPLLDSPPPDAYVSDTTPLFTWEPVTSIAGGAATVQYLWETSADSSFSGTVDSFWTSSTSYQVGGSASYPACSTLFYWRVLAKDPAGNLSVASVPRRFAVYMPGDLNFDCTYDVIDVVKMIEVTFRGAPAPDPPGRAEINCSPPSDVIDVVKLIETVFRGGERPCFGP